MDQHRYNFYKGMNMRNIHLPSGYVKIAIEAMAQSK